MIDHHTVELFILKCAVIETGLRGTLVEYSDSLLSTPEHPHGDRLEQYLKQFDIVSRTNASKMAHYYRLFHMVENDIRRLIVETMEAAHGVEWWDTCVPKTVQDEATKNRTREMQNALSMRSEDGIDYITFGQLSEIIRENWSDFAGMLSNQSAVGRVLSNLNMLRGPIAHCGVLADDEIDRLNLAVRDWFRVLEGPRS